MINNIQNIATPIINRLAAQTGETVYLTIPLGYQVFYLNAIYTQSVNAADDLSLMINTSEPMHLTSNGKAMLSLMPDAFLDDYLSMPLSRGTEYSITDPQKLREELALIRNRGYAVDEQENTIGLRCVGVAICGNSGEVVGGLSVSGSIFRITTDKLESYVKLLKDAARDISSSL